ncbi:hypothetical protein [Patiriisocius marinus]|uniref:hypothetical protein n=1 Tax=Patiriisocius marinus TaxID=1397112 RepID=UPI00232C339F|nr:hypothetical protein [Patiriisocius marinus]
METTNFKGSIQFFPRKTDGRQIEIHTESRLKLAFSEPVETTYNVVVNFIDVALALPGEHVVSQITFAGNQTLPNDLYAGMSFEVFELTKHIGKGTIIEIKAE